MLVLVLFHFLHCFRMAPQFQIGVVDIINGCAAVGIKASSACTAS